MGDKPVTPPASSSSSLHPAVTVTNIKNFVPVTLEMDSGQYTSWAELFKIHCRAFQVLDHIIPPTTESSAARSDQDTELWTRLDAIVIQWIYSTISNDLLNTILKVDATAQQAWESLASIFQDNQNQRAVYLEHKLVTTKLSNFPNCSAYCQALKMLADQLANLGAKVSNQRLVLQLIAGLPESYEGIAMMIQQTNPLPSFYEARSKLILEETRKQNQAAAAAVTAGAALVAQQHRATDNYRPPNPSYDYGNNRGQSFRGRGSNRGRRSQRYNRNSRGGSNMSTGSHPRGNWNSATAGPNWVHPGSPRSTQPPTSAQYWAQQQQQAGNNWAA
ncbi:hypothetical protein SSX86_002696 [Deinandra increscens subsp. villosa]|uniref:Gag protein n=1 Tax=Deinandra increscens subsp. villosa TaxID=3103831 RepID=A0AAP0DWX7_9ASTR